MDIYSDHDPNNPTVVEDAEIVIHLGGNHQQEIFLEEGVAKPDRHFMIGLIQLCTVAVEERDSDVVLFLPEKNVTLNADGRKKIISAGILIYRTRQGLIGCVCLHDGPSGRRIMRDALRRFTGTIRLDIP